MMNYDGKYLEMGLKFLKQLSNFGPRPLQLHALVFDGKNAVLFGGSPAAGAAALNETWLWNNKHWTQIQHIGPTARTSHAMCTDTSRNKIVLFGGATTENNDGQFNDTWEIDTN